MTKEILWTLNVFDGPPPEPHKTWYDWIDFSLKTRIFSGVTIRATIPNDWNHLPTTSINDY